MEGHAKHYFVTGFKRKPELHTSHFVKSEEFKLRQF